MKKIAEQQLIENARRLKSRLLEDGFDEPSGADDYTLSRAMNYVLDTPTRMVPDWLGGASKNFIDYNGLMGYRFTPDWNALGAAGYEGQDVVKDNTGRWQAADGSFALDKRVIAGLEKQALANLAKKGRKPNRGWNKDNSQHMDALELNPQLKAQVLGTAPATTPAAPATTPAAPATTPAAPATTPAAPATTPAAPATTPAAPAANSPAEGSTGMYNGKKVIFKNGKWSYA
jgi:hypothetical protein